MQQPTCTNVRIRSTADAHKIFSAVQQGQLEMVTRRLDADERLALRSGCIYAWEERGPHTETTGLGIERFTEGRRWSPSRVRDEFLFYYEKYSPPPDLNNPGGKSAEPKPPRDWDPLVKQTYSVWVETERGKRKWHLTAYFTQQTIDQLGTIDDIPRVRDGVVPEGMFKSTRVGKSRSARTEDSRPSDVSRAATVRTYAPFPSPYQYQPQKGSPSMTPIFMHEPYQTSHSAESRSPAYEASPSPVSPHLQGQFISNQVAYPNQSASSSFTAGYQRSPIPVSHSIGSSAPSGPYPTSATQQSDGQNYYPSNASSSSWSNDHGYYSSHSQHRPVSEQPTYNSSSPSTSYSYTSPVQDNPPQFYSHSYSLNAALTPLPSPHAVPALAEAEHRSGHISPLQIPDKSHAGSYSQSPTSPVLATGPDGLDCALAPLNILKRPGRYRREPADEKTLRLLRTPQSSP